MHISDNSFPVGGDGTHQATSLMLAPQCDAVIGQLWLGV